MWANIFFRSCFSFITSIILNNWQKIHMLSMLIFLFAVVLLYLWNMRYLLIFIIFVASLYYLIGSQRILERYKMFFKHEYWVNYNIIEFCSWMAKAIIIVPGLIFGIEVWYFHFLTLATSSLLIWASMKKNLPTLILFNTIWICISLTIIIRNIWPNT